MEEGKKTKWPDKHGTRWNKTVILTKPEGEIMEKILVKYDCPNVSQFCKKIVKGELQICEDPYLKP